MGEEATVRKRMHEDEAEYSPSGDDDVEEYDEDKHKLESGEFNSHILQMYFFPTSGPHPPPGPQTQIVFTLGIANTNP